MARLTPPHSREAEAGVLIGLFEEPHHIEEVLEIVRPSDFYFEKNRLLFAAFVDLKNNGEDTSPATTFDRVRKEKGGDIVTLGYYAELDDYAARAPGLTVACARIVAEKAILRATAASLLAGYDTAMREAATASDIIDTVARDITTVQARIMGDRQFASIGELSYEAMKQIDSAVSGAITGLSTGLIDLDRITGGLQSSDLIIVAGRPSHGKTSLVLDFARYAATVRNIPVGIFELEMSATQLIVQMYCAEARVDLHAARQRHGLYEGESARLAHAMSRLEHAPIYIDDTSGIHFQSAVTKARLLKRKRNIGLLIVDYLQLMARDQNENISEAVGQVSRAFKGLAKDLNIPIILVSQLNREVEKRRDKRPVSSDLRDSGSLESDADVILLLYRDEVYNTDSKDAGIAEVNVAKHRRGPTKLLRLQFNRYCTRFDNLVQGFEINGETNTDEESLA
jgi:replicative DNA helicase